MAITRSTSPLSLPSPQEIGLSSRFSHFRTFTSDNRSSNQFDIARSLAISPNRFRGLCMPPGGGKCHPAGTEVIMFDGSFKRVEDIRPFDVLMGPDSTPRNVLETHRGYGSIISVDPTKGHSWKINSQHTLTLVRSADKSNLGGQIYDLDLPSYLSLPSSVRHHLKLFRTEVNFKKESISLFLPPYILGLFLGDGCLIHHWDISKPDPEIYLALKEFADRNQMKVSSDGDKHNLVGRWQGEYNRWNDGNPVRKSLEELGLMGCSSGEKFVPTVYKISSRTDRLDLLAGLLDTDGHLHRTGFDYISKSETLARDVTFISRSLGLSAYISECTKKCQNGFSGQYWRVSINGDCDQIPTRIERKKAPKREQIKSVLRTGFTLSDAGKDEWFGFSLDGDHRYLLSDFTVTHNSLINVSSSLIASPSRTLYLTTSKSLQNQLITEHSSSDSGVKFFSLTGHSSYPCMRRRLGGIDFSSDESECSEGPNCKYWQDVRESLKYSHVTSNIANWVSIAKVGHADRFGAFDYLILDEAHNLEEVLCSLLKVEIDEYKIDRLLDMTIPAVSDSLSVWSNWASSACVNCEYSIEMAQKEDDKRQVKRLSALLADLEIIASITRDWVIQPLSYPKKGASLTPVFASDYAESYLFRDIPDIILSSATLTRDDFKYLGIDTENFTLLDIDTGFDPQYRPFYYWPTVQVDYNTGEGEIRQLINRIDRVISSRSKLGRKGLIHSIAYRHSNVISTHSQHDLITHTKDNFRDVLLKWLDSKDPDCIVSPVMQEGVDLAGDLCRYQIIWKNPTPDARDPLVAARKKRDKKYPYYVAGKKIQQMGGRPNRFDGDAGETFIFDLHYGNWMRKSIEWPEYHKRSWKTVRELPDPVKIPERKGEQKDE